MEYSCNDPLNRHHQETSVHERNIKGPADVSIDVYRVAKISRTTVQLKDDN